MHTPSVWGQSQSTDKTITTSLAEKVGRPTLEVAGRRVFAGLPSSKKSRSIKSILFSRGKGLKPNTIVYDARQKRKSEILAELPFTQYPPQGRQLKIPPSSGPMEKAFVPLPCTTERLNRILQLSREHNIKLLLAVGPCLESESCASNTYSDSLNAWLDQITADTPTASVLCGRVPQVPPRFIGDAASHVSRDARPFFTKWIASRLQMSFADNSGDIFSNLWPAPNPAPMQAITEIRR